MFPLYRPALFSLFPYCIKLSTYPGMNKCADTRFSLTVSFSLPLLPRRHADDRADTFDAIAASVGNLRMSISG